MTPIKNHQAQLDYVDGTGIIIDVREPVEYNEIHIPGAINIPSTTFDYQHFNPFRDRKISLVCQSGTRAKSIGEKLAKMGITELYILETQMENYHPIAKNTSGWTVDRQFRFALGILLLIFLIGHYYEVRSLIAIPIILSSGLIITALINKCYMRVGISLLPWNKGKPE